MQNELPDYAWYAKRAYGSAKIAAKPASVWQIVSAIGGNNRYYYLNLLWTLREMIDWMLGGQGLNRGRRDPGSLRLGDRVDSWTVIGIETESRLALAFGMRAPGAGVLEFELRPLQDGGTQLTVTAYWQPEGISGLLYWYSLAPAHRIIFRGLTREIGQRAKILERQNTRKRSASSS